MCRKKLAKGERKNIPLEETNSIDWAELDMFYLKTEAESSLRKVVF
jgi:hypothetical protein